MPYRLRAGLTDFGNNSECWGHTSDYWGKRAEQARNHAEQARHRAECIPDNRSKQQNLKVTKLYDQMANLAEEQVRRCGSAALGVLATAKHGLTLSFIIA
jgi:hypothetical protein